MHKFLRARLFDRIIRVDTNISADTTGKSEDIEKVIELLGSIDRKNCA